MDTGKIYIGQTIDIHKRFLKHRNKLNTGKHNNKHLQSAWNKYGEGAFNFAIIEECPQECLTNREEYWIISYDSITKGYNQKHAGSSGTHTEETKERISVSCRGINNAKTIITEDIASNIINMLQQRISPTVISKMIGVNRKIIYNIRYKTSWKYLTENIEFA